MQLRGKRETPPPLVPSSAVHFDMSGENSAFIASTKRGSCRGIINRNGYGALNENMDELAGLQRCSH
jgi:hypothetical protein